MVVLTEKSFDSFLKSNEVVVAKFGATWCGPCVQLKPVFSALQDAHGEYFVEIDVDNSPSLTALHSVVSLPTIIKYRNGEEVARVIGPKPKSILEKELGLV